MQFVFVFFLVVGYPLFPESPYYLLKKNKDLEARKMLERIHGRDDQSLIDAEVGRIKESIQTTQALEEQSGINGPPLFQCFKGVNLVRTTDTPVFAFC